MGTVLKNFIQKVRLYFKNAFDRLNNHTYKKNVLQAIPFWVASVITGLIAVLYTKLFLLAESVTRYVYHQYAWALFLLMPMTFIFAWWLVIRYAPYARGSGIPQVVSAIQISGPRKDQQVGQLLSIKVMLVKIASSLVMAAGG